MADAQHTEKPTQRRIERARREGNFPASREFISSIHFLGFVALTAAFGGAYIMRTARLMRYLLTSAFSANLTPNGVIDLMREAAVPELTPLMLAGAGLMGLAVFVQLASTKMGIAPSKLMPDFNRLNFIKRFSSVPAQNAPLFAQALLLLPLVGAVVYYEATENLGAFLDLPWMSAQAGSVRVAGVLETLLWRTAGLFLLVGLGDLFWQRHRYTDQLKMSKQEIREESKEQDGNPHLKARIRRLQRDLSRRRMMKDVPTATAVIVNPTHYAVAIRYSVQTPGAPKVVAKGKNYVAARIRKLANEHQVPIVENPPLAQALYKSVEVGQEIPSDLYRAVAEILAYIYRLMGGHLPG
ncbi:MAG: EscU/YscU/HrcU family type III secretion system export apparatus switch protein [Bryobacteraceae bacterium]